MLVQRFTTGAEFQWEGREYQVTRYLLDGSDPSVMVEDLSSGNLVTRPLNFLVNALFDGSLKFTHQSRINHKKETSEKPNPEETNQEISDFPQNLVEIARFRLQVIAPLLMREEKDRTEETIIARAEQMRPDPTLIKYGFGVSSRSIYRWIADYEASGGDIRALIPNLMKCGGAGKPRLRKELTNLIDSIIREEIMKPEKTTAHNILALVALRIDEENRLRPADDQLKVPSLPTINRRIDALDLRLRLEAKKGKRAAAKLLKQYGKTPYPELPLQRVQIDHTRSDIIVIDEADNLPLGRCTLSFILDMATRYPLGYYIGFEPPSYYAVMETLYHAIAPKPDVKKLYNTEHDWMAFDIPNVLVTDQGKEFIGKDLSDACEQLGIVLDVSPVKTPEFKAGVERFYGTLNTGFFHQLPGTTFSNIFERQDYDSVKQACVSLSELEAALNIFLVDVYSERLHRGLGGVPARRWEYALQNQFSPRLPASRDLLRILLGRVEYRTVQRYGISLFDIRYNCNDLAYLRLKKAGETVKVKYHPGDLSRIHVFNEFENTYIEVPSVDEEYTQNLSLWKHRIVRNFAKKTGDDEDLVALGRALRKIQKIVEDARTRGKKTSTRSTIARWDGAGDPPSLRDKNENKDENKSIRDINGESEVFKGVPELPSGQNEIPALPPAENPDQPNGSEDDWDISAGLPMPI